MACQIKRNADGTIAQVLAPNGKNSILYRDIVNNLSNPQVLTQVKQDPYVSMVLGTEYIKGTDVSEIGLAAWSKAYSAGFINQFGNWKTQTIANTDINGEPNVDVLFPSVQVTTIGSAIFDKQLAQKIQAKLQALYPEIKLNITNNPVWEKGGNIFNQEQFNLEVNYRLKTTKVVLDNYNKIRQWESNKSIDQDILYKKIGELGISKQQLDLLKNSEGNTIEEKLINFISTYNYTVEINTALEKIEVVEGAIPYYFDLDEETYTTVSGSYFKNDGSTKTKISYQEYRDAFDKYIQQTIEINPTQYYSSLTVPGGTNYTENEIATPAITPSIKGHAQFSTDKGIGWFRSDDRQINLGGVELSEEYAPDIEQLPNGKWEVSYMPITGGRELEFFKTEQEAKDFVKTITKTSDEKTRRILEVQSDLFQKGRDEEQLTGINFDLQGAGYTFGSRNQYKIIDEYDDEIVFKDTETGDMYKKPKEWLKEQNKKVQVKKSENQFLQLLNKNNNWVNFFVKAIVQDSAEKGYEKVLFPTGNTASKVEGHTTLEEFKKQKEGRIKELELQKTTAAVKFDNRTNKYALGFRDNTGSKVREFSENEAELQDQLPELIASFDNEIEQLKKELERVETEGFGALKPIYNFYETTLANVLKKQGYNPILITDEYGNTWNEVNINQARDLSEILLQRNKANQIIGQANIKALTVLIDAVNQKQDTLPHEYAHHYIAWYRNTPIVQEAIKKWGSEEALVQAIGEQVVKQKGEAYNWWKNFVRWILNQFNKLSTLQKEELAKILTDAFLTRQDLNIQPDLKTSNVKEGVDFVFEQNPELASIGTQEQYSEYLDTVFPDSQVKDIVYHGTSGFPFEKFSKEFIGKSRNAITSLEKGFYFTNNKKLSKLTAREFLDDSIIVDGKYEFGVDVFTDYAFKSESEISKIVGYDVFLKKYEINTVQDYLKKTYPNKDYKLEYYKPTPGFNKGIASVVLDIKEPTVKDLKGERILDAIPTEKEYRKIIEENDDSIIFENVVDTTRGTKEEYLGNTYVVFEPEQIHILGSKQDIEGFKKFVSGGQRPSTVDNIINMKRWTQTKNNCPQL